MKRDIAVNIPPLAIPFENAYANNGVAEMAPIPSRNHHGGKKASEG